MGDIAIGYGQLRRIKDGPCSLLSHVVEPLAYDFGDQRLERLPTVIAVSVIRLGDKHIDSYCYLGWLLT